MRDRKCIVNVGDQMWSIMRTYGHYVIPPRVPPAPFNFLYVYGRQTPLDIGDGQILLQPLSANDIAADIVQDLEQHGVFVAEGDKPTGQELEAAITRMTDYYRLLVSDGDAKYAANRDLRTNGITDVHRRAALWLKEEREWCFRVGERPDCPYCGAKVIPRAAVCVTCRAILDVDRAVEAGIIGPPEAADIRRARGMADGPGKTNKPKGSKAYPPEPASETTAVV
jgi:hypothetical protein